MSLATPKRLGKHAGLSAAHRHAPLHEKATAKRLVGKLPAGSGNKFEKADVRVKGVLRVELKCTTRNSYSVSRETWNKVERAASSAVPREIPAMEIQFVDAKGTVLDTLAVVPRWVLDSLAEVKA